MEVAAAAAFVGIFLLSNGLFEQIKKHTWLLVLLLGGTIGSAIWLAAAASLWPFYVLAGVYTMVLILVIVFSTMAALEDAKEASNDYV